MKPAKLFFVLMFSFLFTYSLFSQEYQIPNDTIRLKYVFWSSPKYSFDSSTKYWNSNNLLTGSYKRDFKNMFDINENEYYYIKKSQTKYLIGNLGCGGTGGLCFAFALNSDNRNTRNSLIIAGSTLLICDIILEMDAFKDLKNAVKRRNSRIKKIKGYS